MLNFHSTSEESSIALRTQLAGDVIRILVQAKYFAWDSLPPEEPRSDTTTHMGGISPPKRDRDPQELMNRVMVRLDLDPTQVSPALTESHWIRAS